MTESDVRSSLLAFDPLWNELFPAEQSRIISLLVERVDVRTDRVDIKLRIDGVTSLLGELTGNSVTQQDACMTTGAQAGKAQISKDGRTAVISISVSFLQRGGRKQILSPPGTAPWSPAPRVDGALVKAVVRAHRWRRMLESGEYTSSAELAKAEKVNDSYLSRILRLTLIAPDIIEAILSGRQPRALQLDDLLKPLPAAWERQRSELGTSQ